MKSERVLGWTLLLLGVGVIFYWGAFIVQGGMKDGLLTVEGGDYLILHQTAEMTMALMSVTSGLALIRSLAHSRKLALVACGLLLYSGINSMGWSLRNDASLTVIFVIVTITSTAGLVTLLGDRQVTNR